MHLIFLRVWVQIQVKGSLFSSLKEVHSGGATLLIFFKMLKSTDSVKPSLMRIFGILSKDAALDIRFNPNN